MNTININNDPELPFAVEESLNRLLVNVHFLGEEYKKILVISSLEDEGKSFVSANLWRMLAESGEKCVFVDADLRKSVIKDRYQLETAEGIEPKGISHYLSGHIELEEAIFHTNIPNADIVPVFTAIPNPSLLLESKRFEELLNRLSEEYRYVIVDSAPLAAVSDGERIASLCDGAIMIVRAGEVSRKIIRRSITQLERTGCPLLGIVLNRVKDKGGRFYSKYGKYKHGYGYGYGYGHDYDHVKERNKRQ